MGDLLSYSKKKKKSWFHGASVLGNGHSLLARSIPYKVDFSPGLGVLYGQTRGWHHIQLLAGRLMDSRDPMSRIPAPFWPLHVTNRPL